jgi:hypothetical protein
MVPKGGFEPPRLAPPTPQAGVSTNFTTSANYFFLNYGFLVPDASTGSAGMLLGVTAGFTFAGFSIAGKVGNTICVSVLKTLLAIWFKVMLVVKNNSKKPSVTRNKNEPEPRLPNTVWEAPLPNAAPIVAPLPCWTNTKAITETATKI